MPNPIITFDIEDILYNYNRKEKKTRIDNEIRHVYVVLAIHITDSVVESMNKKLIGNKETAEYKWFSKEDFDILLALCEVVPYTYWEGCNKYSTFRGFFKAKAKELTRSDLEERNKYVNFPEDGDILKN